VNGFALKKGILLRADGRENGRTSSPEAPPFSPAAAETPPSTLRSTVFDFFRFFLRVFPC